MTRPSIIVRYEQVYLASFVIGLIGTAFSWSARIAIQGTTPLANATWLLPTTVLISAVATLSLWWFTARRPSLIARVIVTVFAVVFAINILANLFALVTGNSVARLGALVSLVSSILFIAATLMLYQHDARAWFGEENIEGKEA